MARLFITYLTSRNYRHALLASAVFITGVSAHGAALAQGGAPVDTKVYSIPPSEVGSALQTYSEQADVEIIYAEQDVEGKTTDGVDGAYSREAALEEIIGDADLSYEINDDGVVVIKSSFLDLKQASSRPLEVRVARAPFSGEAQDTDVIISGDVDDLSFDDEDDDAYSDVVIVTGTNIRGIAPESSPVRSFSREDIQLTGAATAQDFIQTLPQNFGGGSNPDITSGLPNDSNSAFNTSQGSFGASVNLRGLGSGSTLVLLNGHRIAPSSGIGDFVDISMIPTSAIEMVEILTDGASSIYGADAVAGVVNFVLRDDYDGVEASFRYGTVTEGDLNEYRASITVGESWDTGNALLTYEYFNQDNLSAGDRSFSQAASLPQDLLPSQERHSVLATASQELANNIEVFADFTFSERNATQNSTLFGVGEVFRDDRSTRNLNVSTGGVWEISSDWYFDFSGTYSNVFIDITRTGDRESDREIDTDLFTADFVFSGGVLSIPGGDVKLAVGGQYRSESLTNFDVLADALAREADRDVYALFGELFIPFIGGDNNLPGMRRLELNVSGRFSDFSDFGSTVNPKVGLLWSPTDSLNIRGSFSTSFNPPPLGRVGAEDRNVLVYSTALLNSIFGFTDVPEPLSDVVGLNISGTSANLEAEESRAFTAGFDFNHVVNRHEFSVNASYFDIKFEGRLGTTPIPDNRGGFDAPNIAFNSPELFPEGSVLFDPSTEQINSVLDNRSFPVNFFPGGLDPLDAAFVNFVGLFRNLSLTLVRGIDFDVAYTYESPNLGTFILGVDATYLNDFQQQAAVTTPLIEQLSTQFNPVDLRLRGRAGYSYQGLSANIFVNYTDDYSVDSTSDSVPIDSWTTVDLSLSFDTGKKFQSVAFDDTVLRVSVNNLFDRDPPATPGNPDLSIFGYDPANASPLNRFIAFEITKRF